MLVHLLLVWVRCAAALMLVGQLFRGVWVKSFGSALLAALVIGLINMFIAPVLILLTLPVTILTLGLFAFILNGFLFWIAGRLLSGFRVQGGCAAIGGAFVYSLLVIGIHYLVG